MKLRKLSTLEVSSVGMGTAGAFDVDKEEDIALRRQIMDQCIAEEVTFIDTSPMYGRAEGVLGQAIEGRMDKFQLATKVWCTGQETGQRQIARSFDLLKTDYVDVLQVHNLVDWQTHLPYLEELKAQGKIGLIGLTYGFPDRLSEMMEIMRTGRVDTIQISYNVNDRAVEAEVLPLAEERGIGVIVMRPIEKGGLIAGLKKQPDLTPLKEFSIETWGQAALAWLLADSRVSVPIPATAKPSRIAENAWPGKTEVIPPELREYISKETERCS